MVFACSAPIAKNSKQSEGTPHNPAIIIAESKSGAVESMKADISVWSSIDRRPGSDTLISKYRLMIKLIDGIIYTRIDMPEDLEHGISARSIITNGKEIVMVDSKSGAVLYRGPAPAETADVVANMMQKPVGLFQRINVTQTIMEFRKLNFDVQASTSGKLWTITMPGELLARTVNAPGRQFKSLRICFDAQNGTLAGTEEVIKEEDGTIITSKKTNIYTEKDGIPILIGTVEEKHFDKPYTIDTSDSSTAPFNPTTAPEMSEERYKELAGKGLAITIPDVLAGDPSNPDYTETLVTVYDAIELNTVSDLLFKPFF